MLSQKKHLLSLFDKVNYKRHYQILFDKVSNLMVALSMQRFFIIASIFVLISKPVFAENCLSSPKTDEVIESATGLFKNGLFDDFLKIVSNGQKDRLKENDNLANQLLDIAPRGFSTCSLLARVVVDPSYIRDIYAFPLVGGDIVFLRIDSASVQGVRRILYFQISSSAIEVFSSIN